MACRSPLHRPQKLKAPMAPVADASNAYEPKSVDTSWTPMNFEANPLLAVAS
jgi:hypothetical protein